MNNDIPAGFQIHITTYEGDGDAVKTKIISGLSDYHMGFLLHIASYFHRDHEHSRDGYYTQNIAPESHMKFILKDAIQDASRKHPEFKYSCDWKDQGWNKGTDDADKAYELICEFVLGYPDLHDDDYFCRSVSDIKVYNIPEVIPEVSDSHYSLDRAIVTIQRDNKLAQLREALETSSPENKEKIQEKLNQYLLSHELHVYEEGCHVSDVMRIVSHCMDEVLSYDVRHGVTFKRYSVDVSIGRRTYMAICYIGTDGRFTGFRMDETIKNLHLWYEVVKENQRPEDLDTLYNHAVWRIQNTGCGFS